VPHSALETRPFTVTRVDSLEAFDSFAHEWDDLLRSSEVNGFFLSRAWVRAWYVACAEEFEMFVLAVRDGAQRLVGIAPLALRRDSSELQFAGQSFWGEYLGFILDPRFDRTAADLICRALAETFRASWSSIRLRFVHADSRFEQVLIEHADIYGLYLRETSLEGAPFAALPSDIDAYFETRSSHFAKRVDYLERRLAKTGEVELRLAGENLDVAEGIEEFWRLYNLRWDSFDPAFVAFHRQFAHELVARGEAWLAVLYVAGVAVAARYDFVYAGKVWSYLGGWDREWGRFEVGNVLIGRLLRLAIERGLYEYDFLAGDADYKRRWGTGIRAMADLRNVDRAFTVPPSDVGPAAGTVDAVSFVDARSEDADPSQERRVAAGSRAVVSGWISGEPSRPELCAAFVTVGNRRFEVAYGIPRTDVAEALDDETKTSTGFQGVFRLEGLAPGRHVMRFGISDLSGRIQRILPEEFELEILAS